MERRVHQELAVVAAAAGTADSKSKRGSDLIYKHKATLTLLHISFDMFLLKKVLHANPDRTT